MGNPGFLFTETCFLFPCSRYDKVSQCEYYFKIIYFILYYHYIKRHLIAIRKIDISLLQLYWVASGFVCSSCLEVVIMGRPGILMTSRDTEKIHSPKKMFTFHLFIYLTSQQNFHLPSTPVPKIFCPSVFSSERNGSPEADS